MYYACRVKTATRCLQLHSHFDPITSRSQGMTGKGWAWIGTDGATTSPFTESPNLQRAMQGMIGTRPKNGEGPLYQRLLKIWKEKDAISYPGLVHSPRSQEVGNELRDCFTKFQDVIFMESRVIRILLLFSGFCIRCASVRFSSCFCACFDESS